MFYYTIKSLISLFFQLKKECINFEQNSNSKYKQENHGAVDCRKEFLEKPDFIETLHELH